MVFGKIIREAAEAKQAAKAGFFVCHAQPMSAVAGPFVVLTPACTINALQRGYGVEVHPSATATVAAATNG